MKPMKSVENWGNQLLACTAAVVLAAACPTLASAKKQESETALPELTYADLADLSDAATLVVKAKIRTQAVLEPERSPDLLPGQIRLYVEANTEALFTGSAAIGESLRFLMDAPLDAKGKVPKLKKQSLILFAHAVPGRPDELQLVTPDAYIGASEAEESRVRSLLAEFASPDAPPIVTGIRDALSIEGNLVGESETQIFLETRNGAPVSLNIVRRPGMALQWGVSWTELVDQAARPPRRETLAWYRLACFLPESLPLAANLARDGASRARAAQDYNAVIDQLGPCPRSRPQP